MYGSNSTALRTELAALLRRHRILQRLGGPGTHTVPVTTTVEERQVLGEQIARYRQAILGWCLQAAQAGSPPSDNYVASRMRSPAADLCNRLRAALDASAAGLPSPHELTTAAAFPLVERWRLAARAATLGEQDFAADINHVSLSTAERATVLKDAADITRGLVALDRRYTNIPDWRPLKNRSRLAQAAEVCAAFAANQSPDDSVDHRGWHPRPDTIDGPGLPGAAGVLQAGHNLLVHLDRFPDAHSLRLVIDSQLIASGTAAALTKAADPQRSAQWRAREQTYQQLLRQTRDLGGQLGHRDAAGETALLATRIKHLTPADLTDPRRRRQLDQLFARVDDKISRIIEHGANQKLYFQRRPLPRIDHHSAGTIKTARQRYIPLTAPLQSDLLTTVRDQLRLKPSPQRALGTVTPSRVEFEAAIAHRPQKRGVPASMGPRVHPPPAPLSNREGQRPSPAWTTWLGITTSG